MGKGSFKTIRRSIQRFPDISTTNIRGNSLNFFHLVSPRILSAVLSLAIFSILATQLGRDGFAEFQIPFTLGSLVMWFADFGLLRSSLKFLAEKNLFAASAAWYLRLILIVISSLSLLSVNFLLAGNVDYGLLVVVGLIDAAADSTIILHQDFIRSRFHIYSLVFKKFTQLGLLLVITVRLGSEDLFLISIALCTPAIFLQLLESRHFSFRKFNLLNTISNSARFWISSGGNYLANVDNYMVAMRDGSGMLLALAVGRKTGNAILIFSQAINSRIFYCTAQYKKIRYPGYRIAFVSLFLTSALSLVATLQFSQIFFLVTGTNEISSERLLFYSILISVNLSCISGILNSILNGFGKFKYSSISSYSSTFIYLCCLKFLPGTLSISTVIAISIVLNHFVEVLLLLVGIQNLRARNIPSDNGVVLT